MQIEGWNKRTRLKTVSCRGHYREPLQYGHTDPRSSQRGGHGGLGRLCRETQGHVRFLEGACDEFPRRKITRNADDGMVHEVARRKLGKLAEGVGIRKNAAQRQREEVTHNKPRIAGRAKNHPEIHPVVEHQPCHVSHASDLKVHARLGPSGMESCDRPRCKAVRKSGRDRDAEHSGPSCA